MPQGIQRAVDALAGLGMLNAIGHTEGRSAGLVMLNATEHTEVRSAGLGILNAPGHIEGRGAAGLIDTPMNVSATWQ
ncbi:hypothetical protein Bpfe_018647, partial [Biomphalaria pfeifferi]